MRGVPIFHFQADYSTTGIVIPMPKVDAPTLPGPFVYVPSTWGLQVTGLTAADALATPTSWDIYLQGSIDGSGFNNMSVPMLQHVSTSNATGDVVWTVEKLRPVRFVKLNISALNLGATATKIRISLLGV